MVRIIAGKWKRQLIKTPPLTVDIRPTADRIKEALFSIIGDRVIDAVFLDLCAGSGNIGLEALSRGAKFCCFVENNRTCQQIIQTNITNFGCEAQTAVIPADVCNVFDSRIIRWAPFNIVFADPPYRATTSFLPEDRSSTNILQRLIKNGIVCDSALFVLEHDKKFVAEQRIESCFEPQTRRYGNTAITLCSLYGVE